MYECQCCGFRFEEPRRHKEYTEAWGRMVYEVVSGCPRCGGGYIEVPEFEIEEDLEDGENAVDW